LSHILWFRYFLYDYKSPYLTLEYVIGFFLITMWLVPFAYFISLAANESVLPGAGGPSTSYGGYVRQGENNTDATMFFCNLFYGMKFCTIFEGQAANPLASMRAPWHVMLVGNRLLLA
jgi:hypothetical protein